MDRWELIERPSGKHVRKLELAQMRVARTGEKQFSSRSGSAGRQGGGEKR